jgi:hypothetical protein
VYPYESNGSFVLVFMHNNPMNQLNDEAVPAFGQICKQAESGPACWFSIDLVAIDPFRLARILGKSSGELSIVLKLAGVAKVDRNGVERVNKKAICQNDGVRKLPPINNQQPMVTIVDPYCVPFYHPP